MHRMLIVDDEPEITDSLYELFMESGIADLDILKAYSSREAMSAVDTAKIDILMTDIRMPGINGLQLARMVKAAWPNCRVIFLTGYNEFEYAYAAIKDNCDDYMLKTENDREIIKAVENAIRKTDRALKDEELLAKAREQMGADEYNAGNNDMECLPDKMARASISHVQQYIHGHLNETLSLVELAELVHFNPSYLSRLFKQVQGANITQYIMEFRIAEAKKLLSQTNLKINEITQRVGLDSAIYFARVFKKNTGMTPQEFREANYKR